MELKVEDVKKINLLPGETLVVRIKTPQPMGIMDNFRNSFKELFPNNKLMFIPETMELYKIISEEK